MGAVGITTAGSDRKRDQVLKIPDRDIIGTFLKIPDCDSIGIF